MLFTAACFVLPAVFGWSADAAPGGEASIFVPEKPGEASEPVDPSSLFERARAAVVKIEKADEAGVTVSSGFFIDESGLVVTVIPTNRDPESITVTWQAKKHPAKVLTIDPNTRLALVKVEVSGVPALPLARGFDVPLGGEVYALGTHSVAEEKPVVGRLAGREGTIQGDVLPTRILRLHMAADPADFGGPVLNQDGRVAAVLLLNLDHEDNEVCYALPSEIAHKVWSDYREFGHVESAWLGFTLERGTSTPKIVFVQERSPALAAGLEKGDVIMRISDRQIEGYHDVVDKCYYISPGKEIEIKVLRGISDVTVKLTPIAVSKLPEREKQ